MNINISSAPDRLGASVATAGMKADQEAKPSLSITEAEHQLVKGKASCWKASLLNINAHISMGLHHHLETTPFNSHPTLTGFLRNFQADKCTTGRTLC